MSFSSGESFPSELLREGIVEVRGDNGAFYKAFIVDVDDSSTDITNSLDTESNNSTGNSVTTPIDNSKITLAFENDWLPQQKFPINRIRLPPPIHSTHTSTGSPSNSSNASETSINASAANSIANNANTSSVVSVPPIITEGMEIEVLSCTNDGEQCGWWRAQVKMIKGMSHCLMSH